LRLEPTSICRRKLGLRKGIFFMAKIRTFRETWLLFQEFEVTVGCINVLQNFCDPLHFN
jgi:hypothetical protein